SLSLDPHGRFLTPMSMATAFAKALNIASPEVDITNELTHPSMVNRSSPLPAVSLFEAHMPQVAEEAPTYVSGNIAPTPANDHLATASVLTNIPKMPSEMSPSEPSPPVLPSTPWPSPLSEKRTRWLVPLLL